MVMGICLVDSHLIDLIVEQLAQPIDVKSIDIMKRLYMRVIIYLAISVSLFRACQLAFGSLAHPHTCTRACD